MNETWNIYQAHTYVSVTYQNQIAMTFMP